MAQTNPVNAWDSRALLATESTFGTTPTPASVAAYAARAVEFINLKMGPVEVGQVRPKKDRNLGRGMQSGFVEGRVAPIAFTLDLSVKSRSAVDASLKELAVYKAAGLKVTTNTGTSVVLSTVATPIETADFASMSIERPQGSGLAVYEKETIRGGVVKSLKWEGGDKELSLSAAGVGIGKTTSGALESVSLLIGDASVSFTAEESYRITAGYYLCESEIILVGAVTPGSTSAAITRAQLSTSAAAHTNKPMQPYLPTGIAFTGTPIAEPVCTVTVDGVTLRAMSFSIDLTTGLDLLPGETGSKYVQGAKEVRYDVKPAVKMVLHADDVALVGKVTARKLVALSISQGTAGGGRVTFSLPYCEIAAPEVPDSVNDIAIVDLTFRVRDNSGNDALNVTFD